MNKTRTVKLGITNIDTDLDMDVESNTRHDICEKIRNQTGYECGKKI